MPKNKIVEYEQNQQKAGRTVKLIFDRKPIYIKWNSPFTPEPRIDSIRFNNFPRIPKALSEQDGEYIDYIVTDVMFIWDEKYNCIIPNWFLMDKYQFLDYMKEIKA